MKRFIYLICFASMVMNAQCYNTKWDYIRKFKEFRKIDFSEDSLVKGFIITPYLTVIYNDSTLLCGYSLWSIDDKKSGVLLKLNINTGKHEMIEDKKYPALKPYSNLFAFTCLSGWENLYACYDGYSYIPIYIFGKDGYSRIISSDTICKQVNAESISDCQFTNDGSLLGTAIYNDGAGLIKSRDTGATWNRFGSPFISYSKDSLKNYIDAYYSLNINKFGNQIGIYFDSNVATKGRHTFYAVSKDSGNNWKFAANVDWNFMGLTYYPASSLSSKDTMYAMRRGYELIDTAAQLWSRTLYLYVSYDDGLHWKTIQSLAIYFTYRNSTVFESGNRIYFPDKKGIGLTTNAGNTWCFYKGDSIPDIDFIKMIDRKKGVAYTKNHQFYYFEFDDNFCGIDGFEYLSLQNTVGLTLKGNAGTIGDYVRLTDSKPNRSGALWRDKQIAFDKSFECRFGFNLFEGVNNEFDSTSPGADGIALVISKEISTAPGEIGGGIGYNGISSAVAIEFDSFINKNRDDPNYDHTSVFASSGKLDNNHSNSDCMGTAKIPGQLMANSQRRNVLVKFDKQNKTLNVFLDDDNGIGAPTLSIKDFEFEKYLGSSIGYIGITSATGESMESHFISDFKLCLDGESTLAVEETSQSAIAGEKAYPNPAHETINIELPNEIIPGTVEAIIFNEIGIEVSRQMVQIGNDAGTVSINVAGLLKGVYFVRILVGEKFVSVPFVKE